MRLTSSRIRRFPASPGVYTFTKRGVPIYIGKAANVRQRLSAYLPGMEWKEAMVVEATGLRVERTSSELEALLLESAEIRQHQPKYNVQQRDDKQFLSILVTTDEDFPQVLPTRSHRRRGTYIGPFTSAHAVRETLKALRKVFPFRCKNKPQAPLPSSASTKEQQARCSRACLYFHLGLCAGTCAGRISKGAYRKRVVVPLVRLLRGETTAARRKLDSDHRKLLDDVLAHTHILATVDKYAIDVRDLQRVLGLRMLPRRIEGYDISNIHGQDAVGSMVVAIDGEPDPSEYKRFALRRLEGTSNDPAMMEEVLTRRFAHAPALFGPAADDPHRVRVHAARVGGSSIRTTRSRGASRSPQFWPLPDLMVVDGGKAQLHAALRAMRSAGVHVVIVALAKRNEEIFLPGEHSPLRLPKHSPALHLLQRVRDEAHRFAVSYHRFRRSERMFG